MQSAPTDGRQKSSSHDGSSLAIPASLAQLDGEEHFHLSPSRTQGRSEKRQVGRVQYEAGRQGWVSNRGLGLSSSLLFFASRRGKTTARTQDETRGRQGSEQTLRLYIRRLSSSRRHCFGVPTYHSCSKSTGTPEEQLALSACETLRCHEDMYHGDAQWRCITIHLCGGNARITSTLYLRLIRYRRGSRQDLLLALWEHMDSI